jgi:hypothetical protein
LQTLLADAEVLYLTFKQIVGRASTSTAKDSLSSEQGGSGGMRRRKVGGQFPPTEEDKEEARREKVRERTTREIDELRELLE